MRYQLLLHIDDDEDDQEIFCAAVDAVSPFIQCTSSGDANTALKMLLEGQVTPGVIFLDLNMPGMSGREFLAHIQNTPHAGIPVIVLSTSSDERTIKELLAMGAMDFITKPGDYNELISLLKPILL